MTRRPFTLVALSLVALTLSSCAESTAPTAAAPTTRQVQPSGVASHDLCGGYATSTGKC